MNVSLDKISRIEKFIDIGHNKSIIMIDESEDNKNTSPEEIRSNIYCIDKKYEIIWQVKEIKTKVPFYDDMFVGVKENEHGEIIAYRFSGFIYKIDLETGEAEQIGFTK